MKCKDCKKASKGTKALTFECRYCKKVFCIKHQIPETHSCPSINFKEGQFYEFSNETITSSKLQKL